MSNYSGNLYLVAAPSGAGKTTLVREIIKHLDNIAVSISYTTRPKRPNEIEGVNYYFTDRTHFQKMIQAGLFLEHATVFDHLYGTAKSWVKETLDRGMDVILEIDWQGHQQIKSLFPDVISIFILPPSLAVLSTRLHHRQPGQMEVINKRLNDVQEAVSHLNEFAYVIVNNELQLALEQLRAILLANRLLTKHQSPKLAPLIHSLTHFNLTKG